MTLTMKDNIRDWQSLCEDQMNNSRHPLVDRNAALHQFYGYLMALQQTGFITEEEQTAAMEEGRRKLSEGVDRVPIEEKALGERAEHETLAGCTPSDEFAHNEKLAQDRLRILRLINSESPRKEDLCELRRLHERTRAAYMLWVQTYGKPECIARGCHCAE